MKISINQEKCIGCGACEAQCPTVFKLNNTTGKAEVLQAEGSRDCNDKVVAEGCPVGAISVE